MVPAPRDDEGAGASCRDGSHRRDAVAVFADGEGHLAHGLGLACLIAVGAARGLRVVRHRDDGRPIVRRADDVAVEPDLVNARDARGAQLDRAAWLERRLGGRAARREHRHARLHQLALFAASEMDPAEDSGGEEHEAGDGEKDRQELGHGAELTPGACGGSSARSSPANAEVLASLGRAGVCKFL